MCCLQVFELQITHAQITWKPTSRPQLAVENMCGTGRALRSIKVSCVTSGGLLALSVFAHGILWYIINLCGGLVFLITTSASA